ncbi:MAG: succinate dehydrogenase assembly factor 2 [Beijerinckiaceae bacterium]
MSGSSRSSEGLDPRRRKILYRSWHRGTREMDLILGPFADAHIGQFDASELDAMELLIESPDRELYAWLTGAEATPAHIDGPLWRSLKYFHTRDRAMDIFAS